jgi:hypothetical protein
MERKLTIYLLLLACFCLIESTSGQKSTSSKLPEGVTMEDLKKASFIYIITSTYSFPGISPQKISDSVWLYTVSAKHVNFQILFGSPEVLFIQPARKAVEEMVMNGSDPSLNRIYYAHSKYVISGEGLTASVKENRFDTLDIDFHQRIIRTGLESSTLSSHATAMATLIGGAGNTYHTGKGAAYKARLTSVSFQTLLPEHDSIYKRNNISVQNHSYGTTIENFYGADALVYDLSVKNNDSLLHVFSAGNSGNQTSTAGKYAGITGFANLTGSFKQSKNSLSIGATDSINNIELLSSKGPAYDGRIKPELVAFGQDGSSGAAALVSGSVLLVEDAYKRSQGKLPSSALVRAALINAADDILQPGPDYKSGFGSLNTERAIRQIINNQYFNGSINNGGSQEFNIVVPSNAKELKITLTWNDVPASANATKALVNDLDLEVIDVSSGTVFYPYVLSSFAHIDSLNAVATRKNDTLNNVEQVVIDLPVAGNYVIRIKGNSVQSVQSFDVVHNWETANSFMFTYPTKNDNLYPGNINTIRWNSFTDVSTTGKLEISYDGITWSTISPAVQLSNKYLKTNIKDTIAIARLRMTFGSTVVLSDSFTISPRLETNVGFNCPDSFQLYWNKLKGVSSYTIYGLTDTFMRPLYQISDTLITLPASTTRHFAVSPDISGKKGIRSFTFNYTTQGVGCFINSFLADVFDDTTVQLKAVLGTRHNVRELSFQRLYPLTDLVTFTVNRDTFTTSDKLIKNGIYYYRVKLLLNNGKEVFSDTLQVRIFQNKQFIVYPNPYRNGGRLIIQAKDHENSIFELFSSMGQKVFSQKLKSDTESLSLPLLQTGIYFYRIIQKDKKVMNGKLLVN